MRVLVTGAGGYLGTVVLAQLIRRGHQPVALVHRVKPDSEGGEGCESGEGGESCEGGEGGEGTVFRLGDVRDITSLPEATADVDAVIHLAALSNLRKAFEQPARYFRTNLGGSLNLLEVLSERTDRPRLVAASTVSVYGPPARQPITEAAPADPENPYAASKLAVEQAVGWQASTGSLGAISLRLANIAGGIGAPGDRDDARLITRACAAAAGRIPELDVYGDGGAVRDYVHVVDAADACVAALEACVPGRHRVLNIGATAARVADVIAMTRSVAGRGVPLAFHPAHPCEVRELRVDTTKAREVLAWRPRYPNLARLVDDQWRAEQHRSA